MKYIFLACFFCRPFRVALVEILGHEPFAFEYHESNYICVG